MASKPPAMSQTQTAGSPVCMCAMPSKSARKRARKRAAAAAAAGRDKPCDIASITVGLTTRSGGVTLTGTCPAATVAPLPDVSEELNALLLSKAVVIHYVVLGTDAKEMVGNATASATMKSSCGAHPVPTRTPVDPKGGSPTAAKIAVDTTDWELSTVFSGLWGEGSLGDLVCPASDSVAFAFDSCGLPAGGNATTGLSGVAQIAIADQWEGEIRWAEGFQISFSDETKQTTNRKDGTEVIEHAYERSVPLMEDVETKYVDVAKGKATTYIEGKVGSEPVRYVKENSDSIETDVRDRVSKMVEGDRTGVVAKSYNNIADRLKAATTFLDEELYDKGLAAKITRNGEDVLDTDNWGEILSNVQSAVQNGADLIYRLMWAVENAARIGFPFSLILKTELDLRILQGKVKFRAWPEALPVRQAGTYYLADYRRRFEVGVNCTVFDGEFTFTAEAQVKLFHELIAAGTLTFEFKIAGEAGIDFTFANGIAAPDRKMGGKLGGSVKGTGEGAAASFYYKVEGDVSVGINYEFSVAFDGLRMVNPRHKVGNEAVELRATVRRGNKIMDMIGLGSGKAAWQWPEDGPFVWLEEDELVKTWP